MTVTVRAWPDRYRCRSYRNLRSSRMTAYLQGARHRAGEVFGMPLRTRDPHDGQHARDSPPQGSSNPAVQQRDRRRAVHQSREGRVTRLGTASLSYADSAWGTLRHIASRIKESNLWTMPPASRAWILASISFAVGWTVVAGAWHPQLDGMAFLRFAVLVGCGVVYHLRTRAAEERRRAAVRRANREHVDQTSIFFFTAALILPLSFAVAIVLVLRTLRFRIAHTPLHRYAFSTAAIALSVLGVHAIGQASDLWDEFTGHLSRSTNDVFAMPAVLAMTAAVGWYFAAQAVVVGVARGLVLGGVARRERRRARRKPGPARAPRTRNHWNARALLGDWPTNRFILVTLLIAVLVALASAYSVFVLVVGSTVAVFATRSERERRETKNTSLYDGLTGLLRREQFEIAAALICDADVGRGRSTALLYLDIDDFKGCNTRLGQYGGDKVLRELAKAINNSARREDVVGRWGGEEFVVVLPGTDAEGALRVAERIRVAFGRTSIHADDPAGGRAIVINERRVVGEGLTVSIGVAVASEHGHSVEALQKRASVAMQQAKAGGKNQVVLAAGRRPRDRVTVG